MTKHPHEELASKCPVDLDGAIKLRSEAAGLIEKNDLAFCDMDSAFAKTDIAAIGVKVHVDRCELAKVLSKLYDLEDYITPEKPVKINLDMALYQMETP